MTGRVPYTAAVPLIVAIYGSESGGAGCCLHVALDDGNLDDGSLAWLAEQELCDPCAECLDVLRKQSITARKKAVSRANAQLFHERRARYGY